MTLSCLGILNINLSFDFRFIFNFILQNTIRITTTITTATIFVIGLTLSLELIIKSFVLEQLPFEKLMDVHYNEFSIVVLIPSSQYHQLNYVY